MEINAYFLNGQRNKHKKCECHESNESLLLSHKSARGQQNRERGGEREREGEKEDLPSIENVFPVKLLFDGGS